MDSSLAGQIFLCQSLRSGVFFKEKYILDDPTRPSFPHKREFRERIPAYADMARKNCLLDRLV